MHKFMSNLITNIAQFMPQGIKGPTKALASAGRDGKME
jgi:hypothetical protein